MKKCFLLGLIFLLTVGLVSAQELDSLVRQLNQPLPTMQLMAARNQLERMKLSTKSTDYVCLYYLAYADIELSFRLTDEKMRNHYLNEAESYLKLLMNQKEIDASESQTLKGYWYYALMALDPQTNGPRYYVDLSACYEKALKLNPDNPRALLLSAMFKNQMAQFMNNVYKDMQTDVEQAKRLFNMQDSTALAPVWGRSLITLVTTD